MAKKVTIKPKTKKSNGSSITESMLIDVQTQVEAHAFKVTTASEKLITESKSCPQSMLRALLVAQRIQEAAKKLADALDAKLLEHAEAGGAFDGGKIAVQLTESSRRNVSWKNEAVELGAKVAELEDEEFDKKEFEKGIQSKYPAKTKKSIKLVESL